MFTQVRVDKGFQTFSTEIKQFLSFILFLVLGQPVLGLCYFEFAFAV
jgi:hypothetical protein